MVAIIINFSLHTHTSPTHPLHTLLYFMLKYVEIKYLVNYRQLYRNIFICKIIKGIILCEKNYYIILFLKKAIIFM